MRLKIKQPWRTVLRILLSALLAAAAVYFALREVSAAELLEALKRAHAGWLIAALAMSFLGHAFKTLRWQALLAPREHDFSFATLMRFMLTGQLTNMFIPANAGDWARAVVLGAQGPGKLFSFGVVVLEKVLDTILFAALAAGLALTAPLPSDIDLHPVWLIALAAGLVLGIYGLVRWRQPVSRLARRLLRRLPEAHAQRGLEFLQAVGSSLDAFQTPRSVLAIATWAALIWVSGIVVNEWVLQAFDIQLRFTAPLALLIVLQAGIVINVVPGTLGVFEYLCVVTLGLFGVSRAQAFAYGLVLHLVVLAPLVVGGVWTVASQRGGEAAYRGDGEMEERRGGDG